LAKFEQNNDHASRGLILMGGMLRKMNRKRSK
jgi:hypothetical protein